MVNMTNEATLPQIAEQDFRVAMILDDTSVNNSQSARLINALGYKTTARSVSRYRNKGRQVYVVLPDFQCDLQDNEFLERLLELVKYIAPTGIFHVGDENDASAISRWTFGTPEEHIPNQLQMQVDVTYQWLKKFREIPSVETFKIAYSNHGHRFGQSIRSKVPGWKDMRVVQYEHIMKEAAEFRGDTPLDIEYDVPIIRDIPGVIIGHGDQWNLTSKAQYTQLTQVALENNASVIAGHTHRPLLATVAHRNGDEMQSRFIANVGHAMDVQKADYTQHYRGKTPNWGQGVLVVNMVDGVAVPTLVTDIGGKMYYDNKVF
jgi:hypothetical protein